MTSSCNKSTSHTTRGAAGEVVGALVLHLLFGCRAVIVLTAYLNGKDGRALAKAHASIRAGIPCRIGTEGLAVRQVDNKTNVIRKCATSTNTLFVMEQACSNPQADSSGPPSCWRHVDNLPMNQLGFPLHFVKIFDGSACLDTHGSLSSAVWCPLMADLLHILATDRKIKVTAQPGEVVRAERNEGTNGDPDRAFCNACNTLCPFFRAVEM